jgi:hypothetical protein
VFPRESPSLDLLQSLLQQLNKIETILVCCRLNLIASEQLTEQRGTWLERHLRKQWLLVKELFAPQALSADSDLCRALPALLNPFFAGN